MGCSEFVLNRRFETVPCKVKFCEKTRETYLQTLYGVSVIQQNIQTGWLCINLNWIKLNIAEFRLMDSMNTKIGKLYDYLYILVIWQ